MSPVRVTRLRRRDTDGYVRRDNRKRIRPPAGTAIPNEGLTNQEENDFPMATSRKKSPFPMAESQSNARLRADAGTPTSGVIHVRTRLTADFTVIANALAQRRGSAVTIGVAAYILSLPDGSPVSIAALCEHFTEGEILISRALRELESAGYLERQPRTDLHRADPHPDVLLHGPRRRTGTARHAPTTAPAASLEAADADGRGGASDRTDNGEAAARAAGRHRGPGGGR